MVCFSEQMISHNIIAYRNGLLRRNAFLLPVFVKAGCSQSRMPAVSSRSGVLSFPPNRIDIVSSAEQAAESNYLLVSRRVGS